MLKASLENKSPLVQLLISLLLVVGSFAISMFIGTILSFFLFDINLLEASQQLDINSDQVNIGALKFYQSIYSIGMFIIPPFIFAYLASKKIRAYLFLNGKSSLDKYLLAAFAIILSLPLINLLADINSHLQLPEFLSGVENWMRNAEEQAKVATEKFLIMKNVSDLWINLLMIAVIPALGEELLFRGVIQRIFTKMTNNIHWAIVITAFLFAALHMQFFGLLPRMAMGILFGYLLVWTKNLWVPIIAHLANNGLAVIMTYYINKGNLPENIEKIGSEGNFWISGIISLLLISPILFYFFRSRKREA